MRSKQSKTKHINISTPHPQPYWLASFHEPRPGTAVYSVQSVCPVASLPACQLCLPPHRQTDSGGWYSHPSPPWYSPPLSARSGPDPLGGHYSSSHIGRQTGENPCGLTSHLPAHWSERTRPLVSAGDCRSWCPAISTPNTWTGTRCWPRDGGNSYVITPTRTPVWSLDRTLQPPTHTTPPPLPTS